MGFRKTTVDIRAGATTGPDHSSHPQFAELLAEKAADPADRLTPRAPPDEDGWVYESDADWDNQPISSARSPET